METHASCCIKNSDIIFFVLRYHFLDQKSNVDSFEEVWFFERLKKCLPFPKYRAGKIAFVFNFKNRRQNDPVTAMHEPIDMIYNKHLAPFINAAQIGEQKKKKKTTTTTTKKKRSPIRY